MCRSSIRSKSAQWQFPGYHLHPNKAHCSTLQSPAAPIPSLRPAHLQPGGRRYLGPTRSTVLALGGGGGLLDRALDARQRLGRRGEEDELRLDERGEVLQGFGLGLAKLLDELVQLWCCLCCCHSNAGRA